MICNWCGAVLDDKSESCAECGRKVPPLSDCGGFYHLFRQPQNAAQLNGVSPVPPAFPAEQPPVTPERFAPPVPPRQKNVAVIVLGILSGVLLILCVVLLILLLSRPAPEAPVTDAKPIISDLLPGNSDATPENTDGIVENLPVDSTAASESSDDASAKPFDFSNGREKPDEASDVQEDPAASPDDQEPGDSQPDL